MLLYVALVILIGSLVGSAGSFVRNIYARRRGERELEQQNTMQDLLYPRLNADSVLPRRIQIDRPGAALLSERPVMLALKSANKGQTDYKIIDRAGFLRRDDEKLLVLWDTDAPQGELADILVDPIEEAASVMFVHWRPDADADEADHQPDQPSLEDDQQSDGVVIHLSDHKLNQPDAVGDTSPDHSLEDTPGCPSDGHEPARAAANQNMP